MKDNLNNQWNNKKWFCYGTSMTSNKECVSTVGYKLDGSENSGVTGFYSKYLAEYAGLCENNFGKAGSGIVPAIHGDDCTKSRVMTLEDGKADADLITIEVIPNDYKKAELGEITDLCDDTFCGNLNQMLEYVLANTSAFVAVLTATRGCYSAEDISNRFTPTSEFVQGMQKWEEAVEKICHMHGVPFWNGSAEACLGYHRVIKDNKYVQDQIHLTDEGGKVLAKYFWGKLKNVYPIDKI